MSPSKDKVPPPATLPVARPEYLAPLLSRLLELHSKQHLTLLAEQCHQAVTGLPDTDRPVTYEGLLDVARYCVDEDPGWSKEQRAILLSGHPRIGAKPRDDGRGSDSDHAGMSKSSIAEQQAATSDDESDAALSKLNLVYEKRFPGLRYVTYVAGRPRKAIAEELAQFLGHSSLEGAPEGIIDVDAPTEEAVRWAEGAAPKYTQGNEAWTAELTRGLDALFEIAMDRAGKISEDDYESPARVTPFIDENEVFDEPHLTLERFKELVKSQPLLYSFFETDLPSSFYLVPPPPQQETPREALATLAAVAVTGGGGGDATRRRVRDLLGGLWGEVADRAGKVTGRETRTGPRPAFGREEILRGEEMRAKGSKTPGAADAAAGTNDGKKDAEPTGTGKSDIEDAEANLKAATQRLTDADRSHFVIDEPAAAGDAEGEADVEDEEELGLGMDRLGIEDGGQAQISEKDKALAKDLRTASAA